MSVLPVKGPLEDRAFEISGGVLDALNVGEIGMEQADVVFDGADILVGGLDIAGSVEDGDRVGRQGDLEGFGDLDGIGVSDGLHGRVRVEAVVGENSVWAVKWIGGRLEWPTRWSWGPRILGDVGGGGLRWCEGGRGGFGGSCLLQVSDRVSFLLEELGKL